MPTLTEILDEVFSTLSLTETIDRNPINEFPKDKFKEVWKVETEVEVGSFQKEVSFYIGFKELFPLSIPSIYLTKESFDEIYPIPHIDKKRSICTFHTDYLIIDSDQPTEIVQICLQRAKKIIKEGLEGTNHDDFKDEIKAYWTDNVSDTETIQYLSLITEYPKETTTLRVCKINQSFNGFKYFLYGKEKNISKLFLEFLAQQVDSGHSFEALFLADYKINDKPPYALTNESVLNSIGQSSLASFKEYINGKSPEKHIFFLTETTSMPTLLGWKHKPLNTKVKGYRSGTFSPFDVLSKHQKKNLVEKILVEEYSNHRIENRTSGFPSKKYTFLVAGLGSIGSNLIYFLNGINYPNFKLIDNDGLTIENIGRHLLGMSNINSYKAKALKEYIKNIRPDQDVSVKESKLEKIVIDNLDYFNDCSYAFVAIGNQTVENFLLRKQNEGQITIPMFFFWVEPYAIGGHCLFLHPNDKITIEDLYDKQMYRFNMIDSCEYTSGNPVLSKQEAGCQTSYTPYSGNDIILFLSSIYKWMNDIIQNDAKRSMAIQWTGNMKFAKELGLTINESYIENEAYSNNIIYLNDGNPKR